MNALLAAIEGWDWVVALRRSLWGYGALNAAHIASIGLLLGSIINVDLRMTGLWRGDRWREGLREALPLAKAGFVLAVITGTLLFAVRAGRYVDMTPFRLKMGLLALALANIWLFHKRFHTDDIRTAAMRVSALASLLLWLGILAAGRAIGFL